MKKKKLSKKDILELQKLGKAFELSHQLSIKLIDAYENLGINRDLLTENMNSFRIGDMNSNDFIDWLNEELNYINN